MQYPSITEKACGRLAEELLADAEPVIVDRERRLVGGDDRELDLRPVAQLAQELKSELSDWDSALPKDSFEGHVAGRVHRVLCDIDVQILDDKGFWRYLGLRYFWWLATWREDAFAGGDPGKYLKYVNGHNSTECVLVRVYLRGQIALEASGSDSNYDLASAVPEATDFWRSHITRVNNWKYPALVRAFVEMQRDNRLLTVPLRKFVRSLNRRRSSFWLREHTSLEAGEIVEGLREDSDEA